MSTDPESYHLPSGWAPLSEVPSAIRDVLPNPVPEHAWTRWTADDARGGLPYLILETFWIMGGMIHLLRFDEIVVGGSGVEEDDSPPGLAGHERISLERVEKVHLELGSEGGVVHVTGEGERYDLPTFLIMSHLNAGSEGYAYGL